VQIATSPMVDPDVTPREANVRLPGVQPSIATLGLANGSRPSDEFREVMTYSLSTRVMVDGPSLEADGTAMIRTSTPSHCPTPPPLSPVMCSISDTIHMSSPLDASEEQAEDHGILQQPVLRIWRHW
jgi:hypothetical protein